MIDITLPVALLIMFVISLAIIAWNEYREKHPAQAQQLQALVVEAVRIAQDLKESGQFGNVTGRGAAALDSAIVYVLEQAHARGLTFSRAEVENQCRAIYQMLYGIGK
jgi:predicted lipid-binding transport protein (Tim44 family)